MSWYAANGITLHAGTRVEQIDLRAKQVTARGRHSRSGTTSWSSPPAAAPSFRRSRTCATTHGAFKQGVFVFRTLDDCERIMRYAATRTHGRGHRRRAAGAGGGPRPAELGPRDARHPSDAAPDGGAARSGAADGAAAPARADGPARRISTRARPRVLGNGHVRASSSRTAPTLECDLVVIAAGIRPNVQLAVDAGLEVEPRHRRRRRSRVSSAGRPDVFAVGECAEHRGRVYGLVAPLWEQTARLADRLSGRNPDAVYLGIVRVDQAEGDGRRSRGDGRQGARRRRRRGRQLQRAVARHLQEADRAQRSARRRHRAWRRRRRAVAAADVRRRDRRCTRTAPSCCFRRCRQ